MSTASMTGDSHRITECDEDAQLVEAAAAGDLKEVQQLLEREADACYQDEQGKSPLMAAAHTGHTEVLRLLLEAGAPWNAIDKQGKCAGEYAMESGQQEAVDLLLGAGVRAELLLSVLERRAGRADEAASSVCYLQQRVEYGQGGDGASVLMESENAVMMAWEGPIMEAHAHVLCTEGGDVLNVGFGLGIIDEAIQRQHPRSHTIVEAHPAVYARMKQQGWDRKPGVRIVFGRWQDVIDQLGQYDGIFFDTYSEYYEDLRQFHGHLPKLMKQGGLYSYFNGLAADNPFFHAVTCELVRLELAQLGLATQFVSLPIDVSRSDIWKGVQNRYWQLDTYSLPIAEKESTNE